MTASEAERRLHQFTSTKVAATSAWFFKTNPGDYGAGDRFIGVRVPELRKLAREFRELPLSETETLLRSPIHEARLLALTSPRSISSDGANSTTHSRSAGCCWETRKT